MKYKTLSIKNFGPISDATVDLRAVNLFIGEQSIGKSTLAKLITIFTDHISLCTIIKGERTFWDSLLSNYGLDIYKNDLYHIQYEMWEGENLFHIELTPSNITYYFKDGNKQIDKQDEISASILKFKKIYHHEEVKKKISEDLKFDELLDVFASSLYIPAERIIYSVLTNLMPALLLTKSAIPSPLLRFMIELNNARAEYPNMDIKLLGIKFKHEDSGDSIILKGTEKNIPMQVSSSGIQSVVPLILVLHFAITKREYCSFVVEEPESNLFPTKQVELLKYIIKTVKDPTRTLTITTHSPYLLSVMNNILFAGLLIEKYGDKIKKYVDEIIPIDFQVNPMECSVYSLGEDINGGVYCRSLIDEKTGMIDFNSLDQVSEELSEEFSALQNSWLNLKRK